MPTDTRRTSQRLRRLSAHVIEGMEMRALESAAIPIAKLPEIFQLRAIIRELIGHINAMEYEQAERMGVDDSGSAIRANASQVSESLRGKLR